MNQSNSKRVVALIVSAIFTILLWYLNQCKDPNVTGFVYPFPFTNGNIRQAIYDTYVFKNKVQYGFFSFFIIITIQVLLTIPSESKKKAFLKVIMKNLHKLKLNNNGESHRITIYRIKLGFQILHIYIWRSFIKNFRTHKKKKLFKYYLQNFPIPWFKYSYCYLRVGPPGKTSNIFSVPKNDEQIHGIVSLAILYPKTHYIELPNINKFGIAESKTINELAKTKQKLVRKYIKEGKLKNFEELKRFHRFSTSLWVSPINLNNKQWGVFVIDSTDDNFKLLSYQDDFVSNIQLMESTIKNI